MSCNAGPVRRRPPGTVVGLLVEAPVMLSAVHLVLASGARYRRPV